MSCKNPFVFSEEFCSSVKKIVYEAGELLLSYLNKSHTYIKKADTSFCTEADIASEKFLIKKLNELLPEASIVAEESGLNGDKKAPYRWVIDPLDGTTNFAHGYQFFSVNVALEFRGEPIIGITYLPVLKEFFYAQKGGGAFLNNVPIHVSSVNHAGYALISSSLPYRKVDCNDVLEVTKFVRNVVYSVRETGSASVDLAYVACGRFDASLLKYCFWWDIAAGILLIREAGGIVSEFNKETIEPEFSSCLGSNGLLHATLKRLLRLAKA